MNFKFTLIFLFFGLFECKKYNVSDSNELKIALRKVSDIDILNNVNDNKFKKIILWLKKTFEFY